MAEFQPIESQEALDAIITSRLERAEAKVRSEYADYETLKSNAATLQGQLEAEKQRATGLEAQITELNSKVRTYETDSAKTRIAIEVGLPLELRTRLTGETEDEIRADADALAKLIGKNRAPAPAFNPETSSGGSDASLRELARSL